MTDTQRPGFSTGFALVLAVLASMAIRCAVMAAGSGAFEDPDNYLPLAQTLAAGQGLTLKGRPTAYRPPLYPILLAPLAMVTGERVVTAIAVFHLALGAVTVGMTALAARGWGLGRTRIIAAAWVVALDPVLAWQSRFIMTETLTACLIATALAAMTLPRWRGTVLGSALLGLASLSRPSMLPGAILVVIAGLVVQPGSRRDRLIRSSTLMFTLMLVLSPWAIRNATIFGEPIWTTTHGGYTLALANNEVYYRDVLNGPPGSVWMGHEQWLWWDSVNRDTMGMSETQADRFLRNRVISLAMAQPRQFVRASLDRLGRFWSLAPSNFRVFSRGPLGHGRLDSASLDRRRTGTQPPLAVALAANHRASHDRWTLPGSHGLLDRFANVRHPSFRLLPWLQPTPRCPLDVEV